jgi:hypothetical protein
MPIPGPGTAISMTTIATEFGGTVPHSLSEYYRGGGLVPNTPTNAAIPTSGQIAMNNFYGSANRNTVALTIAANTYNYDVYTNRGPTYVAGSTDVTVTVNPGVTLGSTSTPTYALLVPSAFSPTDTITIVNNGVIQGMGGAGGTGGTNVPGAAGAVGGNAIYVNRPTTITNNGVVASGGGGGGGGGAGSEFVSPKSPPATYGGGGGGGGAGFNGGAGGAGGTGTNPTPGGVGSAGTSPAGGAGGTGRPAPIRVSGPGGAGGGRGGGGTSGTPGSGGATGGSGGATGNYIVGNPFVTWPVTGTRQGNVA